MKNLLPKCKDAASNDQEYEALQDPEEIAKEINCVVVYPQPNQLQLDIDSEEAYTNFKNQLVTLQSFSDSAFTNVIVTPSKSGLPHRHITIDFNENMSPWQQIALQMALFSDPVRECLNICRLLNYQDDVIRLFEPITKQKNKKS